MPTALIGTVLLTLRGRGVGRDELIQKVNWLRDEILRKGCKVADFGGMTTSEIVDKSIPVMSNLISVRSDLLEPVYYPSKRFELSLYRNQVIHIFISEAVISCALYSTIKVGGAIRQQRVRLNPNLKSDTAFISSLLKAEFIFPAGGLEKNINDTLQNLVYVNVLSVETEVGIL
jgi:glycerol-3-phosphate O-acyltransferase